MMYYLSADVNAFEKIVAFLGKTAEQPRMYGVFHVVSLCIIFAVTLFAFLYRERLSEKFLAYSMLVFGIIMTVFEIYKQIVISYISETDTWTYAWSIFPFQFCSTPIYITLIAFAMYKLGKTRLFKTFTVFLGTYSLIGATVVLFIGTGTVLNPIIGINVQTMLHHGIMFVLAAMILFSDKIELTLKTVFDSFKLFCVLVVMALVLNKVFRGKTDFDMFYIAEDSEFVYPFFKELFGGELPHCVYVMGYVALFTLGVFIIVGIRRLFIGKGKKARDL